MVFNRLTKKSRRIVVYMTIMAMIVMAMPVALFAQSNTLQVAMGVERIDDTTLKLTAESSGGTEVIYQFDMRVMGSGADYTTIREYSSNPVFTWEDAQDEEIYEMVVHALSQEENYEGYYVVFANIDPEFEPVDFDGVTLSASKEGRDVKIEAIPEGGSNVIYKIEISDDGGAVYKDIRGFDAYSNSSTYTWTGAEAGVEYYIAVHACEISKFPYIYHGDFVVYNHQVVPTVSVVFGSDPRINSENWIADSEVEIEITREVNSVFEHQTIADGEGDINVYLPGLQTPYEPMGGDLLTMTDNDERHVEYEILFISVTEVDVEENTVSGLADPDQEVEVYVDNGDSYDEMPRKIVVADGDGEWIADFTGDHDLWEGLYGGAIVHDENGNNSIHYWDSNVPHVTVYPHENNVSGYGWLDEVTVTVNGTEYTIDTDNGWFNFLGDIVIEAGDDIVVTDGVTTYTFEVAELELNHVDRTTGVISGTAEANGEVILDISTPWMQPGGGPPNVVVKETLTVDGQGEWSYDGDPIAEDDDIYVIVECEEYSELVRTAVRDLGEYSSN